MKHGSATLTIEYVAKPLQMFNGLKNKSRVARRDRGDSRGDIGVRLNAEPIASIGLG